MSSGPVRFPTRKSPFDEDDIMSETYSFVYSGSAGVGIGMFSVTDGQLVGTDLEGVSYRGTFLKDEMTGEIDIALDQTVPVGVFLVQGTSAQDLPYIKSISARLPADFDQGKPIEVFLSPGPVILMIRRIPDEWEPYTHGVNVSITPLKT
jgi:hypothetical protein